MKDTANSPKVIGPGYRRDPPPKMVGPVCDGDCGCSDCKGAVANVKPRVVGVQGGLAAARKGILQMEPSHATRATLRAVNLWSASPQGGAPDAGSHSSALCWSAKVVDALTEQALARYDWEAGAKAWAPRTVTVRPRVVRSGDPLRLDLATLRDGVGVSLRWILMGGLSIGGVRREER